jgi:glutaconate CoA-transferase subunit A
LASKSKLITLEDAIGHYLDDGSEVVMGTSLETMIPFAAGHEIIRQRKKNLTLIGPISDILFDQIIGAGCVMKTKAAWIGNVITGSSYNFRRAAEEETIETEDHSNLTISMALKAGAMGVPFMPALTALGSDLYLTNQSLKKFTCPFTGILLTAVSAINPDVAIIHVQRSDEYGNAHLWGNFGVTREACLASRHVIITAEEIVSPEVIERDPNRVITPGFRVDAVVHAPWGAHPSPVPGYYNRDHEAFIEYRENSKTEQKFEEWMRCWVDNVKTGDDYIRLIGNERIDKLKLIKHLLSEPADYGY